MKLLINFTLVNLLCFSSFFVLAKNKVETGQASIEKRLSQIHALEESGQLQLALTNTAKLYNEDSKHKELGITYASLLVKTNQGIKAQSVIQPITVNATNDWQVWYWLGSSQLLQNDLQNASDSFSKALSLNGEEISIWVQQAIVEQEKGNSKAALNLLQVANNLQPDNPGVLINYAYASEKEGKINEAVKLYRYFLRLSASDKSKGVLRSEIMLRLAQISSAQTLVDISKLEKL